MANSEDYLDGLLDSVKTVRSDVKRAEEIAEESRKQREEQRNSRISPDDDFMEANGLHDYTPEPTSYVNLRKAFSEDDFLREFEEDLALDETDVDAFIRDFEEEIEREEMAFSQKEETSFMDSIENIVNQAKEQIEQGEISLDMPEEEEEFHEDTEGQESVMDFSGAPKESDMDGEVSQEDVPVGNENQEQEELPEENLPNMDEDFQGEAPDIGMESPEEEDLPALGELEEDFPSPEESGEMLDEDNADMDLMDLLSGDADLGDIGALLQADDENIELEESQEEFELQADAVGGEDDLLAGLTEEPDVEAKKPGFFQKILSIFAKKSKDDCSEKSEEVLDISGEKEEDVSQENLDILKSLDEAEQEQEAKEKKRKEKKEKKPKEKKEKKPKEPREKKPKKERVPDNSPKIPTKLIMVFVALSISVVVLITLGQSVMGYRMALSNARSAFNSGEYFTAYEELMGVTLKEDDQELFRKARLLGDLQKRNREYQILMDKEKYPLVLDSLVIGVARYVEHYEEAKELGIEDEYKTLGESLVQLLSDQFGVTRDDAVAMYKLNREEYSIRIDEIIEQSNL